MSRPLRIEYPGALYHVTSRGNRHGDVFRDDDDRRCFMAVLAETCETYGWVVHSYCQMCNHWHMVVETPDSNLSAGMRQLNGIYTQRLNRRHGTVGHLYQGRYKAFLVEKEPYFLELCRYVVLNPVRAGMVDNPAAWEWSSFRATSGLAPAPEFLDLKSTRSLFSADRAEALRLYREFVLAGVGTPSPLKGATGGILGSEEFIVSLAKRGLLPDPEGSDEVPRRERYAERRPLADTFAAAGGRRERDALIRLARRIDGYGVSEIARALGLHVSTVSNIIQGR